MSFDECIPYPATRSYVEKSVERTLRWAKRGKEVLIILINLYLVSFKVVSLRTKEKSAIKTAEMDFDGYSIGGTSVGEPKDVMYKMISDATLYLPKDKPRYLMGVGEPIDLLEEYPVV